MAGPVLIAAALSDLIRSRSNLAEDIRANTIDGEEEREIEEGREEDEAFRRKLGGRLASTRMTIHRHDTGGKAGKHESHHLDEEDEKSAMYEVRQEAVTGQSSQTGTEQTIAPNVSHVEADTESEARKPGFWRKVFRVVFGKREDMNGPKEGDPDYVYPKYRWTPIFSGIVQPFSILLEIPSLTEHWYVKQVDGVPIVYQENPVLLDVGLAISMACAVVANVALISRFLERRVFTSTMVCIVMLSIHDIINITALIIFGVIHGVDDGFDYSEAFWMCVCSTTASFFTNITLVFDLIKTKQFRHSGSGLTPKQRKLVIVVMVLLTYIALGALVFNFLLPDIAFQNALYFTIVSIETIGFGDISPNTGGRIFLFFYVPIGILNLAVAVGTARDALVESWSSAYRRRRHKVVERQRQRKGQRAEEAARLAAAEVRMNEVESMPRPEGADPSRTPVGPMPSVNSKGGLSLALSRLATMGGLGAGGLGAKYGTGIGSQAYRDALAELSMENEESYKAFQDHMRHEEQRETAYKVSTAKHLAHPQYGTAVGLFIVFWLVGAGIFTRTEDSWDFFTGLYFCFVTFTTIVIIWAICGVGIVTLLFAVITEAYSNRYSTAVVARSPKDGPDVLAAAAVVDEKTLEQAAMVGVSTLSHDVSRLVPNHWAVADGQILHLLKDFETHMKVVRLYMTGDPQSHDAGLLMDQVLANPDLNISEKEKAEAADRKELFCRAYEAGIRNLHLLAEKAIQHTDAHIEKQAALESSASSGGGA